MGETPWTSGSCHPKTKRKFEDLKEGFPMGSATLKTKVAYARLIGPTQPSMTS